MCPMKDIENCPGPTRLLWAPSAPTAGRASDCAPCPPSESAGRRRSNGCFPRQVPVRHRLSFCCAHASTKTFLSGRDWRSIFGSLFQPRLHRILSDSSGWSNASTLPERPAAHKPCADDILPLPGACRERTCLHAVRTGIAGNSCHLQTGRIVSLRYPGMRTTLSAKVARPGRRAPCPRPRPMADPGMCRRAPHIQLPQERP